MTKTSQSDKITVDSEKTIQISLVSNTEYYEENKKIRAEYHDKIASIPAQIENIQNIYDKAKMAFDLRNQYRQEARNNMNDEKAKSYLEQNEKREISFGEFLKQKMQKYNCSIDEALEKIIESSTHSNAKYDNLFKEDDKR